MWCVRIARSLLICSLVVLSGCISAPHDQAPGFLSPHESTTIAAARRAGIFVDTGRLGEAEKNLRVALASEPNSASVLNGLGYVLMKQDRIPEALSLLLRARKLRPEYTPATINIARAYAESDDFERALPEWERALMELQILSASKDRRLFSENELQAEIGRTYQGLSAVYAGLGMLDEAACFSGRALDGRWNLQTVASHERLLLEAGRHKESVALLDKLFGRMQVEDVPTSIALDYAVSLYQGRQFKRSASTLSEITQARTASADEATVAVLLERLLPAEAQAITSKQSTTLTERPAIELKCTDKLLTRYSYWPPGVLDQLKQEETKVCADENKSVTPAVS